MRDAGKATPVCYHGGADSTDARGCLLCERMAWRARRARRETCGSAASSAGLIDPTSVARATCESYGLVSTESACRPRELEGGVSSVVLEVAGPESRLTAGLGGAAYESRPRPGRNPRARTRTVAGAGPDTAGHRRRRYPLRDRDRQPAPGDGRPWKHQRFAGTASEPTARGLAETLGAWHRGTAVDAGLRGPFEDRDLFLQLRVDPRL